MGMHVAYCQVGPEPRSPLFCVTAAFATASDRRVGGSSSGFRDLPPSKGYVASNARFANSVAAAAAGGAGAGAVTSVAAAAAAAVLAPRPFYAADFAG